MNIPAVSVVQHQNFSCWCKELGNSVVCKIKKIWKKTFEGRYNDLIKDDLNFVKKVASVFLSIRSALSHPSSVEWGKVSRGVCAFFHNISLTLTAQITGLAITTLFLPLGLYDLAKKCRSVFQQCRGLLSGTIKSARTLCEEGVGLLSGVGSILLSVSSVAKGLCALKAVPVTVLKWAGPLSIVGGFFGVFECVKSFITQRKVAALARKVDGIYRSEMQSTKRLAKIRLLLKEEEEKNTGLVTTSFGQIYRWIEDKLAKVSDEGSAEKAVCLLRGRVRATLYSERIKIVTSAVSIASMILAFTPAVVACPYIAVGNSLVGAAKLGYDFYQKHHFRNGLRELKASCLQT